MNILCDLILLSWNHLEQTRPCLESLFRTTDVPSRLFIVDNGSEVPVREFLRAVRPAGAIHDVVLLQNETNEGFPKGMNRGIHASTAPYVCLLNNDLLFTAGWLSRLLNVAQAHPEIGVLNPISSTFGGYRPTNSAIEEYAKTLQAKRGQYVEVGMCIGFCMVIKQEVLACVGALTEEVERIFFEDEDFSMKAQRAGYQCVTVASSYVYHAEHQTVRKMPEREALFTRNQQWCNQKWGKRLRVALPRFTPVQPGSPELRTWLERLIGWARWRSHIYVYCPMPAHVTADELFRSVGLIPHADIHWRPIPSLGARWAATGQILARQKKRFDAIVAPEAAWANRMQLFSPLHRAPVILESNAEELARLWKGRPLSLSSS